MEADTVLQSESIDPEYHFFFLIILHYNYKRNM